MAILHPGPRLHVQIHGQISFDEEPHDMHGARGTHTMWDPNTRLDGWSASDVNRKKGAVMGFNGIWLAKLV